MSSNGAPPENPDQGGQQPSVFWRRANEEGMWIAISILLTSIFTSG